MAFTGVATCYQEAVDMLDILSNGYVMMGMVVAVLGLAAVLFLTKSRTVDSFRNDASLPSGLWLGTEPLLILRLPMFQPPNEE